MLIINKENTFDCRINTKRVKEVKLLINFNLRIKSRLMLIMVLLVVMAVASIGIYSYTTIKKSLKLAAHQDLIETIDVNRERLSKWLKELDRGIYKLTEDTMLTSMTSSTLSRVRINYHLNYLKEFDHLLVLDNEGKVFVSSNEGDKNKKLNIKEHKIYTSIKNIKDSFKGVAVSPFTGNNSYIIAYPIIKNDKINGLVVGLIEYEHFYNKLSDFQTSEEYEYVILNDENRVII